MFHVTDDNDLNLPTRYSSFRAIIVVSNGFCDFQIENRIGNIQGKFVPAFRIKTSHLSETHLVLCCFIIDNRLALCTPNWHRAFLLVVLHILRAGSFHTKPNIPHWMNVLLLLLFRVFFNIHKLYGSITTAITAFHRQISYQAKFILYAKRK